MPHACCQAVLTPVTQSESEDQTNLIVWFSKPVRTVPAFRVFHSLYKVGRNGNFVFKGFNNSNRAWLNKDLKVLDLQANACLAYLVRHWTPKPVIICSIRSSPTGGNFFLLLSNPLNSKLLRIFFISIWFGRPSSIPCMSTNLITYRGVSTDLLIINSCACTAASIYRPVLTAVNPIVSLINIRALYKNSNDDLLPPGFDRESWPKLDNGEKKNK